MIQAIGLTSTPRKELPPVVDDVSFEAHAGHVTALLGAPGAGKTTALRLMLELQQGRGVTYFRGRPLHRIAHPSREVGVLLGDVPGHPARTVRGHLRMLCAAAGVPVRRADEVLEAVGLVSLGEERLGALSRGMDRRLGLACALLSDPHTLVLDHPADGLSARESRWLHGMLRAHAAHGGTVLLTTPDPKEAARTADRVVTLEQGRLVADQAVTDFARTRLRPRVAVRTPHAARLAALLTKQARASRLSVEVVQEDGNRLSVYGTTCAAVGETAFRHGILVHQLADEIGDMGPGAPVELPGHPHRHPETRANDSNRPRPTTEADTQGPLSPGVAETVADDRDSLGPGVADAASDARDSLGPCAETVADTPAPVRPCVAETDANLFDRLHLTAQPGSGPDHLRPAATEREADVSDHQCRTALPGSGLDRPGPTAAQSEADVSDRSCLTPQPAPGPDGPCSASVQREADVSDRLCLTAPPGSGPDRPSSTAAETEEDVPDLLRQAAVSDAPDHLRPAAATDRPAEPEPTRATSTVHGGEWPGPADPPTLAEQPHGLTAEPSPHHPVEVDARADADAHADVGANAGDPDLTDPGLPARSLAPTAHPLRTTDPHPAPRTLRPPAAHSLDLAALPPLPPPISVRPAPSPLRPLRYELRRVAGISTAYLTAAAVLVTSALTAVLLARVGHTPQPRLLAAWPRELPLPPAAFGAGLLGALAFGDEFRHPALAADRGTVPRRLGLLAAKLLVTGATALLLASLTVGCDAEVLYLVYGRELAQVPTDWVSLSASWTGLVIGCAWAGVLAAGVFRSTTAGLAAVLAVPVVVVPLVQKVLEGPSVRTAAGIPMRLREVLLLQWPFGGERYLSGVARVVAQPVGGALTLSLTALLCAYLLTTLRGRVR
ncbi:ATP-binding cassette domain-containing protein [Streptomyces sp. NPDC048751]|uniref:ATP-binding cassette domain-containing protein n=1 Tax=Streptomyces sp. NPDC048751 TaxID=3365591 RepID=UPI0037233B34